MEQSTAALADARERRRVAPRRLIVTSNFNRVPSRWTWRQTRPVKSPRVTFASIKPQITRPPLPAAEHLIPRTDGGYSCNDVAVIGGSSRRVVVVTALAEIPQ
jgi:hypothetical protein